MSAIFISYRRDDSKDVAGRLVDRLRLHFAVDQLFLDIDTIPAGTDFETVLSDRLKTCDVLLALIGPQWLDTRDAAGQRRIDNPKDYVRREIAAALARKDVRVVPVLVSGARLPPSDALPDDLKPLTKRHASELRYERFNDDVNDLIRQISDVVRPSVNKRLGIWKIALAVLGLVIAAGVIYDSMTSVPNPRLKSDPVLREEAIKLCKEASEVTARLASTSNAQDWSAARDRFWVLYKGPLYTIETREKETSPDRKSGLEAAMVRFGRLLKGAGEAPKLPLTNLDQASLDVASACTATVGRM